MSPQAMRGEVSERRHRAFMGSAGIGGVGGMKGERYEAVSLISPDKDQRDCGGAKLSRKGCHENVRMRVLMKCGATGTYTHTQNTQDPCQFQSLPLRCTTSCLLSLTNTNRHCRGVSRREREDRIVSFPLWC